MTIKTKLPLRLSLIIFITAMVIASPLLFGGYHGEDEALTQLAVEETVEGIKTFDLFLIAKALGSDWHPPGRNLLPVPFFMVFGDSLWVLRLPNMILWAVACVATGWWASAIASESLSEELSHRVGFVSGLWLATSGLFQLEGMGLGHVGPTLGGLILLIYLSTHPPRPLLDSDEKRNYLISGTIAGVSFIWFSSMLAVAGMLHLCYLLACLRACADDRRPALVNWLVLSIPFGVFYVVYYAVFLGVPYYMLLNGFVNAPFGQLHQYIVRSGNAQLGVTSLIENMRVLNYYLLPGVGPLITVIGAYLLIRRKPNVGIVFLPYAFLFCFYINGNTGQHFLSFAVWVFPLSVGFVAARVSSSQLALHAGIAIVTLQTLWTGIFHIYPYTATNYPYRASAAWGDVLWPNNSYEPVHQISKALSLVGAQGTLSNQTSGYWELQVLPDLDWVHVAPKMGPGNVCAIGPPSVIGKAVVASLVYEGQWAPCVNFSVDWIRFPGSNLSIAVYDKGVWRAWLSASKN